MAHSPMLTIMREGVTVKTLPLQGEISLGRSEDCTIRLDDRAISRVHAQFRVVGSAIQVENKSEFAPLLVNGAEVTQATLKEGDIVSVGPYFIRVSSPAEVAPQPPPPAPDANSVQAVDPAASEGGQPPVQEGLPGMDPQAAGAEGIPLGEIESPPEGENQNPIDNPLDFNSTSPEGENGVASDNNFAPSSDGGTAADPVETIDEDGKTKVGPIGKIFCKLVFEPETANVTEFELKKDEVSIGRGKNCDIVLNDKKASRKNSIIKRTGLSYSIQDLDSANGTFVNDVRIQEQELAGDDVIKIGGVEFRFIAVSSEYLSKEKDFMPVPAEEDAGAVESQGPNAIGGVPAENIFADANPADPNVAQGALLGAAVGVGDPGAAGGISGITGIPGVGGAAPGKKKSLLERFRALPKRTQLIGGILGLLVLSWLMEDEEMPLVKKNGLLKKPTPTPTASSPASSMANSGPLSFESLSPEKKQFVEAQHNIAFDYYRNKEYDKALFEIEKIFSIIPDYKDAREIERYAREGKRKMDAIEEERKKKEDEAKLKAKIARLVDEARIQMEKKNYEKAKDLFSEILALDPDNTSVSNWKKEIETFEEEKRINEQQKQVQVDINKHAWQIYNEGMALKKAGKYHSAISTLQRIKDIGASDKNLLPLSKKQILACQAAIRKARDPLLKEAKQLEESGELTKALPLYVKATKVDPPHPAGYQGIKRIKAILHDRAKVVYTEAILAESYSDFATAKKMFQECLQIAAPDDIYHDRAQRKLSHYFKKDEAQGP